MKLFPALVTTSVLSIATIVACRRDSADVPPHIPPSGIKTQSVTPALVYTMDGFNDVKTLPLISSEDKLEQSPDFIYGAQPDGGGFMRAKDGGYIMINNHEINQSVSRVYLDKDLKPVKGEYILDYTGGAKRLCSATLALPEITGFGPTFLTAQESGPESMVVGLDPYADVKDKANSTRTLPALGKASMENAVPLPKEAFPNKTVIIMGEDQSYHASDASKGMPSAGQLIVYISNTVGDLENGKLYALKRKDNDQVETNIAKGQSYDVELVEITNAKNMTGLEIDKAVIDAKAILFSRVEDIDYGKGNAKNNRDVYFTATGQSPDKVNPEPGFTMWGRVYKVSLNETDPTKGGKLELIAEGDSNPGNDLINPDNLCVTENYVYIQEDGDSYYKAAKHDSWIWQYNIASKTYKPFITTNQKVNDAEWQSKFNQSGEKRLASWEYGAMVDISDIIGVPNTFTLNIHPHTWRNDKFLNADGGGFSSDANVKASQSEGGQTVILTNVPR